MGKWWKSTTRRPGYSDRVSSCVLALAMVGLGLWHGGGDAERWPYWLVALLIVGVGELRAIRAHADARWDDMHGPIRETLRVRGEGFEPEARPGAVVMFAGREFRAEQVQHNMERCSIRTDFEATRGGEGDR
jgi:hypothetical protein